LIALICRFCSQWNPADAARCRFCDNPRDASEDLTASGRPLAERVEISHLIDERDGDDGSAPGLFRAEISGTVVIAVLALAYFLLRLAC